MMMDQPRMQSPAREAPRNANLVSFTPIPSSSPSQIKENLLSEPDFEAQAIGKSGLG